MFNCAGCKRTQAPRTKPHRTVVEKRTQVYNYGGRESRGWEIVKEVNFCDNCHEIQLIQEANPNV